MTNTDVGPMRTPHSALWVREAGEGPPLVLLHGLASSSRYWEDMRPLTDWYRVIAPDLLGFGRSPKPNAATYTPAEHVAALGSALAGRTRAPFVLLGHSLGSLLALHYALAFPEDVRALVLISLPVVGDRAWGHHADGGMNHWHRFSVHTRPGNAVCSLGMKAAAPLWRRVGPRLRQTVPPDASRDALAGTWQSYWRSLEAVVFGTDARAVMAQIQAPVLLLHGPADFVARIEPVRALAAAQPALRLVEIAEAGHNPYYIRKQTTAKAIRDFISSVDRERAPAAASATLSAAGK